MLLGRIVEHPGTAPYPEKTAYFVAIRMTGTGARASQGSRRKWSGNRRDWPEYAALIFVSISAALWKMDPCISRQVRLTGYR
jgi:hypothetical protein